MAILDSTIVNGDLSVNGNITGNNKVTIPNGDLEVSGAFSSKGFKINNTGATATVSGNGAIGIGQATASGDVSLAIGWGASARNQYGIAIGPSSSISGDYSISIGYSAQCDYSTSKYAVAIGYSTYGRGQYGVAIGRSANAKAEYSIAIGNYASGPDSEQYVRIGTGSYGYTGRKLMLGGGNEYFTYMNAAGSSWSSMSDIRDKTDIQEIRHSLDFIKKIHPITYVVNNREDYLYRGEDGQPLLDESGKQYYDVEAHERGDKKKHRRFAGVSAQETYQAMIDCYKDDNYAQIVDDNKYDHPEDEHIQQYTVQYERFIPFLIKAIQEQQEQIETLQARLDELENPTQEIIDENVDDSSEE